MAQVISQSIMADWALLDDGLVSNVLVDIGGDGNILAVTPDAPDRHGEPVAGVLLPGMTNLHSHAFQRSFAGRTSLAVGGDDFWSWRDAMYRAAGHIEPEAMHAIAAYLAMRLLERGYTGLVEFHYLFNQRNGTRYADPTALADAVVEGARGAGIGLTMLFGIYETGGFGGRALEPGQRRFANTSAQALRMLADAQARSTPDLHFGLAPHSLRAVPPASLHDAVAGVCGIDPSAPMHIHVAEQTAEVAACIATLGAPPVAWLLDHAPVAANWCLIHATHAAEDALRRVAQTGAVAGLCPSTEADLGDGIFPFGPFTEAGGRFGIGSDSNVCMDPCDELRLLEYAQRLSLRRRNLGPGRFGDEPRHTGPALWQAAALGGAQASGRKIGRIAPGCRADFCVLAPNIETQGAGPAAAVDAAIFAPGDRPVRHVMAGGTWLVRDGRHRAAETMTAAYRAALAGLP
jgi:formimidoylglutamate deiminase